MYLFIYWWLWKFYLFIFLVVCLFVCVNCVKLVIYLNDFKHLYMYQFIHGVNYESFVRGKKSQRCNCTFYSQSKTLLVIVYVRFADIVWTDKLVNRNSLLQNVLCLYTNRICGKTRNQILTMVLNDCYFIVWYVYSALRYFNEFSGTTVGLINRDIIRVPL